MPRRGHKKSRAGCTDCKRRHVKCDESRPSCVNCKVASLTCSYLNKSSNLAVPVSKSPVLTPSYSPLTPETTTASTVRHDAPSTSALSSETINLDHLELLHHYETMTYQSFTANGSVATAFRNTAITQGLRYPWLMCAILAVAAIHKCKIHPERSAHYRTLASSLQAAGLARVKDNLLNISADNCVALFIFCATTGLQSFCETFGLREHNFNIFLDKLTGTISLMRGVRQVMSGGWWDHLRNTELNDLLAGGAALGDANAIVDKDRETRPLWELLSVIDIGPASFKIYEETVIALQRVFNAESRLGKAEASVSMAFAWPVIVSAEYNDMLQQRRPEALVILAFYGVILHQRRAAWAVGDSGQFLFHSIAEYLGHHWDHWLQWPKSVITSTPILTAANTPS